MRVVLRIMALVLAGASGRFVYIKNTAKSLRKFEIISLTKIGNRARVDLDRAYLLYNS